MVSSALSMLRRSSAHSFAHLEWAQCGETQLSSVQDITSVFGLWPSDFYLYKLYFIPRLYYYRCFSMINFS